MKTAASYLGMIAAGIALIGLSGCATTFYSSSARPLTDDLYAVHDKQAIAQREAAEREQARKAAEAAALTEAKLEGEYLRKYTGNPYEDVLADTYDDAYARRLRGFNSPTYKMPSSYYNFKISDAAHYVSAYDPSFYNVMVMGDEVWVEPKYITSMFGYWGSPINLNINLGWGYPYWSSYWGWYDPWWSWGSPWWGYPYWGAYYSWGYPYWNWGYPYYWGGHHHWGGGYYSRPDITYRSNYRPYNNRYGNSTGYRSNTRNSVSGYNSYRNRYDKDNSSSSYNYRYSRPSNSGSTYRPSGGSSGSYGTPSGGGGSYGGGSRGGGGRGR